MSNEEVVRQLALSQKENEELKRRVEELTDFVENASVPLHWVNGSGIIIWANSADYELLGYTEKEYVGNHISNFHADKEVISDILDRLIKKETLKNYPARLICKNGDIKHVLINSNVLWKDDEFIHTRCFTRDVSELKSAEREKVEQISVLQSQNITLKTENAKLKRELKVRPNK